MMFYSFTYLLFSLLGSISETDQFKVNPTAVQNFLDRIQEPTVVVKGAGQACFSPDGYQIAYTNQPGDSDDIGGGGIFILTLDGAAKPLRLTQNGKDPAWSPDGRFIVFDTANMPLEV